jgi:hypothetical protein
MAPISNIVAMVERFIWNQSTKLMVIQKKVMVAKQYTNFKDVFTMAV